MIAQQLALSPVVEGCDVIQYERRGIHPRECWNDMPEVPDGYVARGPWVCVGECEDGWLWARPLDVDPDVRRAEEDAQQEAGMRALREKWVRVAREAAERIAADLERGGLPGPAGWVRERLPLTINYVCLQDVLEDLRIHALRAIGAPAGIRAKKKSDLVYQIAQHYWNEAERALFSAEVGP